MKHFKKALMIMLILLVIITATWFIVKKYYLYDMVHDGIAQRLEVRIENEFHFTYDDLKINWVSSKIQLIGFNLMWFNLVDTVGYFKGDLIVDVKGWKNILLDKQKGIKNIILKEASIYYAADHPLILKNQEGQAVKEIEISNTSATGKMLLVKKHKDQRGQLTTKFDFTVPLRFNNTAETSIDQLIKQFTNLQLTELHYYFPDGFYQMKVADVSFTSFDDISLKQVIINPIYSRKVFAQKKKLITDYVSVSIDSIQLLAFDSRLTDRIYIDQIHMFQPSIDVYKDRNYPEYNLYKPILVDLLQEIETPVYVKGMELKNMFIKYTELAKKADEAGYLFFSEAYATVTNITNIKDSLQHSDKLQIEAKAKFYGAGMLNTSITYNLLSGSGQFGVRGSLSPMDIGKANAILSKILPAKINSGQLDKLRFNFSGTRMHATGEMWFEYSDLKAELLKVNFWDNKFTRNVASSLGNRILRNSNPAANGTFRVGAINQDRDTTKSMFNFWWISLQSGFLSTVGVKPEKQLINYKSGQDATLLDKIGLGDK